MPRPLARVLTLLELLQSGGTRTVPELAGRLGVDERTVRRYAHQLADLGIPVESVRGRYGGYRLGPGYRMPPLMLNDDEALAVLLGLAADAASDRAGDTAADAASDRASDTARETARETAAAKIRRVLPHHLRRKLDAVLGSLAFTEPPAKTAPAPDPAILLPLADAVHHHHPVAIRYTAADGHRTERTLHPYGVVAHAGHWYVTAADLLSNADRTFRLDRITDARPLPGTFTPPPGIDPAERVLTSLATAPHRHQVSLRIQAPPARIHPHLPPGLATVTPPPPGDTWSHVTLHVTHLTWLPATLAALNHPFTIESPAELRTLVEEFATRLMESARRV
ncbi:helix-turn-helix transcriptional regulator [Streptomyces sp. LaPpAH-108]|uniref:helix-turn-helix transcriptional regulator n=1 Tax=Streptomyces sp. LaPpAH-108 TaxID=1155714 RepID=UPI000371EC74|nr:transcriptional regulator [Streptomyces sp. LaPpAH-108]